MAQNLQIGDVVILNSGGPKMTVEFPLDPNANRVTIGCIWFHDNEINRFEFATEILSKGLDHDV